MKLIEASQLLRREPLILRPEGRERRLQPFGQAGRAIVVAHIIKDISHGKSPDSGRVAPSGDGGSRFPQIYGSSLELRDQGREGFRLLIRGEVTAG